MKIELSPIKTIKDAITVWSEAGPEVDIVMDLKNLTFKEGSIDAIYSLHVLDHLFIEEIYPAIANWIKCLKPGGKLFTVTDDFEYIARALIGGDITIELFNDVHNHPTQLTRDFTVGLLRKAGFKENNISIWYADVPGLIVRKHYELILESTKND